MSPYGVTRPQWVNLVAPGKYDLYHENILIFLVGEYDKSITVLKVLTLNMLNCFKDYKRYIHILNLILDLAWPK